MRFAEFLELERRVVELCVHERLVQPRAYRGRTVITHDEVERVRVVWTLTAQLGVNWPGVRVALRLISEIERLRGGRDMAILDVEDI